jgi:hypothetical protein
VDEKGRSELLGVTCGKPVKIGKHRTEVTEATEGVRRPWAPNPTRINTRGRLTRETRAQEGEAPGRVRLRPTVFFRVALASDVNPLLSQSFEGRRETEKRATRKLKILFGKDNNEIATESVTTFDRILIGAQEVRTTPGTDLGMRSPR